MRLLFSVFLIMLCGSSLTAQSTISYNYPTFDKVKFEHEEWAELVASPDFRSEIGHIHRLKDGVITELNRNTLTLISEAGIDFEVVQKDMESFYKERIKRSEKRTIKRTASTPENFNLGSFGGFLTLSEIYEELDEMAAAYPNVISVPESIGSTIEGREIRMVKIGTSPEGDAPESLFTSLHHSREPGSATTLIYYMWWLLENYDSDQIATYLIDNRNQYFIPVVNPDGYELNRQIAPNGGGLWRKNARRINGEITGVDLNRNYGPEAYWDSPRGGSSVNPGSQTYRGTSPFSEPETQAVRDFVLSRDFKTALNYHTYGDLLIYPFGFNGQLSPDSLKFRQWAEDMTRNNEYFHGTDTETVGYNTRGNSDDWFYGDSEVNDFTFGKYRTYVMTPEAGDSFGGFWPARDQIIPIAEENLWMNQYTALIAGSYSNVDLTTPSNYVERGETFEVFANVKRLGISPSSNLTVEVSTPVEFESTNKTVPISVGNLEILDEQSVPLASYMLRNNVRSGLDFTITASINENGMIRSEELSFRSGELTTDVSLAQNYPNPFNPETVIEYSVPVFGQVTLDVYNLMGQKVATLVDETQSKNTYSVVFNAAGLASGIYYYRLMHLGDTEIGKMTLIK